MNIEDIDLLGHYIHPRTLEYLASTLTKRRDFMQKAEAERIAAGEKPLYDKFGMMLHEGVDCYRCGRNVSINWTGDDADVLTLGMVFKAQHEVEGDTYWPVEVPEGTPCPVPEILPTTVRFTCRSGRVALGNDFRHHFPDQMEKGHRFEINNHAGKDAYIRFYASHGYLTGFVGNTRVWFVEKDGGLDVMFPSSRDERITEEEFDRLDRECVHYVSTELWWFAVVDAADLPEGATDSFDRPVGFLDLPVGEYEVVVQPETNGDPVVATLRPVH